ncbi:MAG TPA: copper homeostasis protein CutC [Candidatus Angelobacter sp.]|nr:copper homeostasis protein CutC [Candidatus Angelobacter sp.]
MNPLSKTIEARPLLEICIDSVESALASQNGGAERVELCANLLEGGTTPSLGTILRVREQISIQLQVIIRPRGGDFHYSADEFEVMQKDIAAAKQAGADGVVLGLLLTDGSVDKERTRRLVEAAHPMNVTFHRAFDMLRDPLQALEDVIETGANRILTSGGEASAMQGASTIAALVRQAQGRITILAGGGIRAHNALDIIRQTAVREIHVGFKDPVPSLMEYRNPRISMGTATDREYQRIVVLEEKVRSLKAVLLGTESSV